MGRLIACPFVIAIVIFLVGLQVVLLPLKLLKFGLIYLIGIWNGDTLKEVFASYKDYSTKTIQILEILLDKTTKRKDGN